MVKPDGSLPEPLCFLLFAVGPEGPLGDAGRERFLGVKEEDVSVDAAAGMANGLFAVAIGKFGLKLCCMPWRSLVEKDCLNSFEGPGVAVVCSPAAVANTPAPGTGGAFGSGAAAGGAGTALWVL